MAERRFRISTQDPIGIRPDEPRPRTRVNDESAIEAVYRFGDVLGKGTFGVVREVIHLVNGKHFAMKIVQKDKPGSLAIQLMEREVEILNRVRHPHIISLEEVFETPKKVFLILELCRGGELSNLLKEKTAFREEEAKELMKMLTEAVVYMHDKDMVHRDLKLENILVSTANPNVQFDIKVTDFGLSYMKSLPGCDGGSMYQKCGTLHYMAPEIVRNQHEYSKLCDVWSMGVIMYNLLCGHLPFNGTNAVELENNIVKGTLSFSEIEWISISNGAKELIRGMLKVAPIDRLTARQVLEDPWITGGVAKRRVDLFELLNDSPDLSTSDSSHHTPPQNTTLPVPPSFPPAQESPVQIHVEKTLSSHSTNSLPRNTTAQKPHQNHRPRSTTIGATSSRKTSHPVSSSRPSGESAKSRKIPASVSTGHIQSAHQSKQQKQSSARPHRESMKR